MAIATLFAASCASRSDERDAADIRFQERLSDDLSGFHLDPTLERYDEISSRLVANEELILRPCPENLDTMASFYYFCELAYGFTPPVVLDTMITSEYRAIRSEEFRVWVQDFRNPTNGKLDVYWMGYFVTGDAMYLDHVLYCATLPDHERVIDATVSSARWSYKANCKQHADVLAHALSRRNRFEGPGKAFVEDCIARATGK